MLPSFARLHIAMRLPVDDATGVQTDEDAKRQRLARLRTGPSLIPQDPRARELRDQRSQLVPQQPATMQPLIDHFVTKRFLSQWKVEELATRHWLLHRKYEIPAVFDPGFPESSLACDILCLNAQTKTAAIVVCTLHTPRNFMNALGEVLRHGYYYRLGHSTSIVDMVGIIALDREPRMHEQNLATQSGVQCWWPKRSIAECLGEALPDAVADKENVPQDP
jgi:hypothetical protein